MDFSLASYLRFLLFCLLGLPDLSLSSTRHGIDASPAKSFLSLHGQLTSPPLSLLSYLYLPYPFLPPLLNRSLRQQLRQTWPPSWDQEEANAFLMRPRPQCDTVKWQESVAGEPLVQGIYHLKPSDPLCLWEGGREQ